MINVFQVLIKSLEWQINLSDKFYAEVISKFTAQKKEIDQQYKEEEVAENAFDELLNGLIDDYHEQENFENLTRMLIVSHNYFIFEHFLKLLIGNLFKQEKALLGDKYRRWHIDKISYFFEKRGVRFTRIKGYKECETLRILVNDIKHNGAVVSKKLAEARGENFDKNEIKQINVSPSELMKYSEAIKLFYRELVRAVEKR